MIYVLIVWSLVAGPDIDQGKKFFAIGEQLYEEGKYKLAADTLAASASIFEELNKPVDRVRSVNLQAEALANLGQCDKAGELLQQSLATITGLAGDNKAVLADTYYYLSRYTGGCARRFDDAIKLMQKSTALKTGIYKPGDPSFALDYTFLGYLYNSKGKYDSALLYLDQAMAIRKKNSKENDLEISHTLFNLAASYEGKSDLGKALSTNLRALKIRKEKLGELHATTSNSINSIGRVYRKLGDPERALEYYRQALATRKKTLGATHPNVAASYYEIGNLYGTISNYHAALEYVQQGNRILEANTQVANDVLPTYQAYEGKMYGLIGDHESATASIWKGITVAEKSLAATHPYRAIVYNMAAEYYGDNADIKNQKLFADKAITIYKASYGAGSEREGDVIAKLAATYAKLGDYNEALKLYNEALTIYTNKLGVRNPKRAAVYAGIGDAFMPLRNHYQAALSYDSAVAIASREDNKPLLLKIRTGQGKVFDGMGSMFGLNFYEKALELVDEISKGYNNEGARIQLEKSRRELYVKALERAWIKYERDPDSSTLNAAFNLIEKSKATLLSENLRDQNAKRIVGVPDSLINKERELRIELTYYNNAVYQMRKNNELKPALALERTTFDLQRQLEGLRSDLEKNYPAYYKLKYERESIGLRGLRRQTPENTTVVEYFVSDSAIYAFIVTRNSTEFKKQKIDDDFRNTLVTYQKCLTDLDFILSDQYSDTLYSRSANKLASLLMIPEPSQNTTQKLVIIPDDFLAQLNFGTLQSDNTYLNDRFVISYSYSATSLHDFKQRKSNTDYFAGFAPSYDNSDYTSLDTTAHPMTALVMRSGHLPLPGAAEEVNLISDLMSGKSWLNEEATETNFKKYSGGYDVLHLAMHSLLNNEEPRYSELVFNRRNDNENDGYLSIAEIYNLELNAQLVVLSSCSSGFGKIQHGEGPISLSRAFSYAGCPSVVMSLWKVPDQVTTSIMQNFYESLNDGASKDEALRLAQRKFLDDNKDPLYRHPYYWAGFVVIGDTAPLQSRSYLVYYLGGILLAAGVLAYIRRK